ncbi:MAG TPA: pantoate--beta-alanine ligase [Xanthomonadales bacterium]|nr:pantoate--beta-alanine ligase [Xanthomonadales bacterium]
MMNVFERVAELRARVAEWRGQGLRIGFVPTMGNLHDGHFALVDLAREHADRVVSSIFVNPTQFGPNEDYALYPRTPDSDITGLRQHGVDALLLPSVEEMYPFGTANHVQMHVPGITDILCGRHRPGHFNGVATVVARLFNMVQPDVAVFGRKDYQQLQVVRYMTRDLAFPIRIIPAPTLREPDGLAMSSRNRYLDSAQRTLAPTIHRALLAMRDARRRDDPPGRIEGVGEAILIEAGFVVDYVEVLRSDLSRPRESSETGLIAFIAARLGRTRLIDNLDLD